MYAALPKGRRYLFDWAVIRIANFVGAWLTAQVILPTRMASLSEKACVLAGVKTAGGLVSLFFPGAPCNVFIFIAVDVQQILRRRRKVPGAVFRHHGLHFLRLPALLCRQA